MKNKELEEKMMNLYLDGYGPDGPPIPDILVLPLELDLLVLLET
jgi:hypothetical protein